MTTQGEVLWPGMFNAFAHRVRPENATRLHYAGWDLGQADCGVACLPRLPEPGQTLCPDCEAGETFRPRTSKPVRARAIDDAARIALRLEARPDAETMARVLDGLQRL